jgi:hypothetical protein
MRFVGWEVCCSRKAGFINSAENLFSYKAYANYTDKR